MDEQGSGSEVLAREECIRLLTGAAVGHLGVHTRALPVVLPVAFALDGRGIVIRVRSGSPLDGPTRDAVVAFEVDDMDPADGRPWCVTVTGETGEITDPAELAAARALPLSPCPCLAGDRFVRISLDLVSGTRAPSPSAAGGDEAAMAGDGNPGPAAVAETHSGVVVLLGDRAYKVKKPVDLGFLDFTTREARYEACRREVALNRRLAPDVYLGVADVVGPGGRRSDHMVVMRRMPDERRLSHLVGVGADVKGHLGGLARLLAEFHRDADRSSEIDEVASRDAQARRWHTNAAEMAVFRGPLLDPALLDEVIALTDRYLEGRGPLFDRRIGERRACDGHGDLLADDIFCLDDGPRVLDCLEFDDRLRFGDALSDVAFLAMDLERLGRPDLGARFLEEYRRASGDDWPDSLADHYVAYRAQVRAKVASVRWRQGDPAAPAAAARLLRLCRDHLDRARVRLVLVGGLPGAGKSTVARRLAGPLRAVVLRSDEVRKELAGIDPLVHVSAGVAEGIYRPAATQATYAELLARAGTALGLGRTVVLDATWLDATRRSEARRLARDTAAELVELRCEAPLEVAVGRVRRRLAAAGDPSDATEEIVRRVWASAHGWASATGVDTSGDSEAAVAAALAAITEPPAPAPPPPVAASA